jgi:hypothetical protein
MMQLRRQQPRTGKEAIVDCTSGYRDIGNDALCFNPLFCMSGSWRVLAAFHRSCLPFSKMDPRAFEIGSYLIGPTPG